jgi:DNA modification methylase
MEYLFAQADALRIPLADDSVDLAFTSPPYLDARAYGDAGTHERGCGEWLGWMLQVVEECVRVCRGLVIINCAGVTRNWQYVPAPEGLLYKWYAAGGHCWRPCIWHRKSIPGSGGKQWYRADTEYLLAFTKCLKAVPWADPKANGKPPVYGPGGEMSHRTRAGHRINQGRRGKGQNNPYKPPNICNPGNLVHIGPVGGGNMGSSFASLNEAPFPQALPAYFIRSHCPPGGTVLDPFSGSGSTVAAALSLGRKGIGLDIRENQCALGNARIESDFNLTATNP